MEWTRVSAEITQGQVLLKNVRQVWKLEWKRLHTKRIEDKLGDGDRDSQMSHFHLNFKWPFEISQKRKKKGNVN